MRTDLLIAGGLAALVVGATIAVGRRAARLKVDQADAIAVMEAVLRESPDPSARATGYAAAGEAAIVERTAAPGWVYVYAARGEGYAPETSFAFGSRDRRRR